MIRFAALIFAALFLIQPASVSASALATQARPVLSPTLTPPMGWNSWNHFKCRDLNERVVKAQANALIATGLRDAGYVYVNLDDCWQGGRDSDGHIFADTKRFPSGLLNLANELHAKGLKLGVYTDRGLQTCQKRPGSFGYEIKDAATYASWMIDFIKEDNCYLPNPKPTAQSTYVKMFEAIRQAGRPMVFSLCNWGEENVWSWAGEISNLWRTHTDIRDSWSSLLENFDANTVHAASAGPGHWNDPDMLEIGNGGMTATEYRTQMSLWAVSASPLIAGNDLSRMSPETLSILGNREVIAIDQDAAGRQGTLVFEPETGVQIYSKPLAPAGSRAVVILNRTNQTKNVDVPVRVLGLESHVELRDVWQHKELGPLSEFFHVANLAPHESKLVVVRGNNVVAPRGVSSLSDLVPFYQAVGWGGLLRFNSTVDRHSITLNSTVYSKGFSAHADSELGFQLPASGCSKFQAQIGIDDEVGAKGSAIFQVWGDDKKIYESAVLVGGAQHKSVSVVLNDVKVLRLRAMGTSDGIRFDHADWADPKITCN